MISERTIKALGEGVKARIIQEWQAQGHSLTGAFERSLTYKHEGNTIEWRGKYYGKFIEQGVTPQQIRFPFAKKRLEALKNYCMLRLNMPEAMAKKVAGAIAYKHSREGMPLPSTARFSKTGKRTGFIQDSKIDIVKLARFEFIKIIKAEIYDTITNDFRGT
jgi:hypothetical protein